MASLRKVYCTFPKDLIREPVLHYLSKRFDVISNIRGASITDQVGLVYLEIEGDEAEITRAVQYLKDRGVKVDDVKETG
jgi:L-aspartate semialdehyde sulfurtransferase ferredoxin